jgi:hypothetical protein
MEPSGRNRSQMGNGSNKAIGNRWQATATVSERMVRSQRFESVRGLQRFPANGSFFVTRVAQVGDRGRTRSHAQAVRSDALSV